jgi:hypothetical protein
MPFVLRLVLWSLGDADANVEELRAHLRDTAVDRHAQVPGLLLSAWVSDEASERWGHVQLWDSRDAAEQPLPAETRELLGKDPEIVELFDVEATTSVAEELARLGLAYR